MRRNWTFVVAGVVLCGSALAQGPGGGGKPQPRLVLEALDSDHDGILSAAEIAAAPEALRKLDLNDDGQLTPDELTPRLENAGANPDELVQELMVFDKNGDGVLTVDEVPARMAGMFRRGDANHDGKLTAEEIRAMASAQGAPNGAPMRPGQAGGAMRLDAILNALDADHDGTISAAEIANASAALRTLDKNNDGILQADEIRLRPMSAEERAQHMLDEWDTNKDGKLTKDEAPERMGDQFSKVDINGDGFLDLEELTKYFAAMPAGRSGQGGPGGGNGRPGQGGDGRARPAEQKPGGPKGEK